MSPCKHSDCFMLVACSWQQCSTGEQRLQPGSLIAFTLPPPGLVHPAPARTRSQADWPASQAILQHVHDTHTAPDCRLCAAGRRPRCRTGTRLRPRLQSAAGMPRQGHQAWGVMPRQVAAGMPLPGLRQAVRLPELPREPPQEAAGGMQPPQAPRPARIAGTRPPPLDGYVTAQRGLASA